MHSFTAATPRPHPKAGVDVVRVAVRKGSGLPNPQRSKPDGFGAFLVSGAK